ncbi:MAG: hypothetical protein RLZZ450_2692 [Pseudomonadota bacterium]|jgi:hypothetical protein
MIATVVLTSVLNYSSGKPMVDRSDIIVGADFSAFWIGGQLLRQGREAELYDIAAQKSIHAALIAPARSDDVHPYINPPFFAVALQPLAALPYRTALSVWWSLGVATLLVVVWALRRELGPLREHSWASLVFFSLAFYPTLAWFVYGQNSAFTLLLSCAFVLALRRGYDTCAGLALGLLLFKPQLALGPVLVLVTQRRGRALSGVAIGASVWLLIGLLGAPHAMRDYLFVAPQLFSFIGGSGYPVWGLESLYGFGLLLVGELDAHLGMWLGYALTAAGALVLVLCWRGAEWSPRSRAWELRMAGTLALSLVISPHLYHYDAMLLLLPLALLLANVRSEGAGLLDRGPLLARTGMLWVATIVGPHLSHVARSTMHRADLQAVVPQLATCAIVWWAAGLLRSARTT